VSNALIGRRYRFVESHDAGDRLRCEEWNVVQGTERSIHTLISAAAGGTTESQELVWNNPVPVTVDHLQRSHPCLGRIPSTTENTCQH
jgi:hypothetical protein